MNVVYDLLGFQSRDHGERGIARYVLHLALGLERSRPGLITEYLMHPDLPFPAGAEELLATGRVVRADRPSPVRDPSAGGVFIAGSPFESYHYRSEHVLPTFARSPYWRSAAVIHDLIPAIFPELYLSDPANVDFYDARFHALRGFDRFLTNSEATTADAIRMLDLDPAHLTIVGAGADERFARPPNGYEAAAETLIADGRLPGLRPGYILFPTGIDPRKNIERTIQAYGLVAPEFRRRHQLVLSCRLTDPDREHLERVATEAGVSIARTGDDSAGHELLVTGYVSDDTLCRLYQGAHLVVFPSYYEGFGLPALEAMRCGAPVICADATSLREVQPIAEARFDPLSAEAIAAAIERALADRDLRRRLRAQKPPPFTWELAAERTAGVVDELAGIVETRAAERSKRYAKPRLAIFSPLPPQPTGTADYTFQLLETLRHLYDVTVFVSKNPLHVWAPEGVAIERARNYRAVTTGGGAFDRELAILADDRYHRHCLHALERQSCAALFLSPRLTNVYNERQRAEPGSLRDGSVGSQLRSMYPGRYRAEVEAMSTITEATANRFGVLMAAGAAQQATDVFVHSEFAASMLQLDAGVEAKVISPFPCPPVINRIKLQADHPIVAVLGALDRDHQTEKLISAWARAARPPDAVLRLAGEIEPEFRSVLESLVADLGVHDSVELVGPLTNDDTALLVDRACFAVQLSSVTDGSNSAMIANLLTNGLPTVVSAIGPTAELPDSVVVKVDPSIGTAPLGAILTELLADENRRRELEQAAEEYAKRFSHAEAALHLTDLLFTSETSAEAPMYELLGPIRDTQQQTLIDLERLRNGQATYLGDNQVLTRLFTGQKIFVDSRDTSVAPALILDGRWEGETTDVFLSLLRPSDTVIDIGANLGYFGLIAGTIVDREQGGSIHLLEANPRLIPLLFKSLNVTGLVGMATLANVAVSDEAGVLQLHVPDHLWGSAFLGQADDAFRESIESTTSEPLAIHEVVDVPAVTLDEYTAEHGIDRVDVIKMDIEGHEERAYRGMSRILDENRNNLRLLLEFSGGQYDDPAGFVEQLRSDFKFVSAIQPATGQLIAIASYAEIAALSEPGFVMLVASNDEIDRH